MSGPGSLFKPEVGHFWLTGLPRGWDLAQQAPGSEIPSSVFSLPGPRPGAPRGAGRRTGERSGEEGWSPSSPSSGVAASSQAPADGLVCQIFTALSCGPSGPPGEAGTPFDR